MLFDLVSIFFVLLAPVLSIGAVYTLVKVFESKFDIELLPLPKSAK